jgi:hypothetical protein
MGLLGTPLGIFTAPRRARRLSTLAVILVVVFGGLTWYFVSKRPFRRGVSMQVMLPLAFLALAFLGFAVRRARVAITRDGVRWGWSTLGFHQERARIVTAHVYRDGVALEAKRGSWWFLAARDWERFDALVRNLRRADLPVTEHDRRAPLRARLQSYGRFLDGLMVCTIAAAFGVMLWAS